MDGFTARGACTANAFAHVAKSARVESRTASEETILWIWANTVVSTSSKTKGRTTNAARQSWLQIRGREEGGESLMS